MSFSREDWRLQSLFFAIPEQKEQKEKAKLFTDFERDKQQTLTPQYLRLQLYYCITNNNLNIINFVLAKIMYLDSNLKTPTAALEKILSNVSDEFSKFKLELLTVLSKNFSALAFNKETYFSKDFSGNFNQIFNEFIKILNSYKHKTVVKYPLKLPATNIQAIAWLLQVNTPKEKDIYELIFTSNREEFFENVTTPTIELQLLADLFKSKEYHSQIRQEIPKIAAQWINNISHVITAAIGNNREAANAYPSITLEKDRTLTLVIDKQEHMNLFTKHDMLKKYKFYERIKISSETDRTIIHFAFTPEELDSILRSSEIYNGYRAQNSVLKIYKSSTMKPGIIRLAPLLPISDNEFFFRLDGCQLPEIPGIQLAKLLDSDAEKEYFHWIPEIITNEFSLTGQELAEILLDIYHENNIVNGRVSIEGDEGFSTIIAPENNPNIVIADMDPDSLHFYALYANSGLEELAQCKSLEIKLDYLLSAIHNFLTEKLQSRSTENSPKDTQKVKDSIKNLTEFIKSTSIKSDNKPTLSLFTQPQEKTQDNEHSAHTDQKRPD